MSDVTLITAFWTDCELTLMHAPAYACTCCLPEQQSPLEAVMQSNWLVGTVLASVTFLLASPLLQTATNSKSLVACRMWPAKHSLNPQTWITVWGCCSGPASSMIRPDPCHPTRIHLFKCITHDLGLFSRLLAEGIASLVLLRAAVNYRATCGQRDK
jgi:hypothetical protein